MKERRSCKKQNDSSSQLGVCALLPPPPALSFPLVAGNAAEPRVPSRPGTQVLGPCVSWGHTWLDQMPPGAPGPC